jgi:pSer/pThr/pTyr-binding forkhead associated (FHA) protein
MNTSGEGGKWVQGDAVPPAPSVATDAHLSLHIVRTGQILPLMGREEFIIGRVSEGQSVLPDIDLTPYDAYSQGVSRLHAMIQIAKDQVSISDLGSSNGTRINKTKLTANRSYSLNHGDVISLGKFKIQALIRQNS